MWILSKYYICLRRAFQTFYKVNLFDLYLKFGIVKDIITHGIRNNLPQRS